MDQGDPLRVERSVLAPSSQEPIISKIKVTVTAALGESYLGKAATALVPNPWSKARECPGAASFSPSDRRDFKGQD